MVIMRECWRVASGEWRVASGEWRVASGEWRVSRLVSALSSAIKPDFYPLFCQYVP